MPESRRRKPVTRRSPLTRLQSRIERFALRGLQFRLLLAAMIIAAVAITAGLIAAALSNNFSNPGEAIWWAFLRLTDSGYLGDDEGFTLRTVSTILTVLGLMLFVGLVIAILTQWVNQTVRRLETGISPVVMSDHVILLGWTNQVRPIVQSLLLTRGRLKRFLALRGARDLRIVIMADQVDEELRQRLRERLGRKAVGYKVFLRAGTPLRLDHLERVAFRDASVLILPGAGFAERNPEHIDARTIKTLASVSKFVSAAGAEAPVAVAELFDARRVEVAQQAYDGPIEVVATDAIVSRLIAQCVWYRGLWSVMSELFTVNGEHSIQIRKVKGQAGQSFGAFALRFSKAVLLGIVQPAERRPMLNPDLQTVIGEDDLLVFLARGFDECVPDREVKAPGADRVTQKPLPARRDGSHRVLILGWSRKVPALMRELERLGGETFEVDIVSRTAIKEREEVLERDARMEAPMKVRQIRAAFSQRGVIEELEPEKYDDVVVLASELLEEKEHADAVTVVATLTMRAHLSSRDKRPDIIVEVLDEENEHLFHGMDEDVIVSPMVVAYIVSQVALRRELAWVFWELTSPRGAQIVLLDAIEYLAAGGSVRFDDAQRAASARGHIALGFRRPSDGDDGLRLNPDRGLEWVLQPGDEVVALTSLAEREVSAT